MQDGNNIVKKKKNRILTLRRCFAETCSSGFVAYYDVAEEATAKLNLESGLMFSLCSV